MPYTTDENGWPVWTDTPPYVPTINTTDEFVDESVWDGEGSYSRKVANPNYVAPKPTTLEGALQRYNQSNFDIGSTAALIRQLGQQSGLSEAELVAAVPVFGDEHRSAYNSGYTEGSNYNAIAQRAVSDALRTKGVDPSRFTQATQGFVDQGAQQAEQRWQATQEDDDGLGNILALAAMAVAAYVTGGAALAAFGGEAAVAEAIAAGVAEAGAEAVVAEAAAAGVGGIDAGSLSQILGNGGYAAEAVEAASVAASVDAGQGTTVGVTSDSGNLASLQNNTSISPSAPPAETYPITDSTTGITATELPAYDPAATSAPGGTTVPNTSPAASTPITVTDVPAATSTQGGTTDLGGGLTVDGDGNVTGGTGTNTGGSIDPTTNTGGTTDLGGGLTVDGDGNVTGGTGTNTGGSIDPTTNTGGSIDPNDLGAGNPEVNKVDAGNKSTFGSSAIDTNAGGNAVATGTAATGVTALSALTKLFGGEDLNAADIAALAKAGLSATGAGISSVLSYNAAKDQTQAYKDLADEYLTVGAPSRTRYENSYAPGFSMSSDPGYSDSLTQASKANLASLSTGGNPALSPNAQAANMLDLQQKTAYPALQNYRNTNSAAGGLSTFAPASQTVASTGVGTQPNASQAIGTGIAAAGDIFNTKPTAAQQYAAIMSQFGKSVTG